MTLGRIAARPAYQRAMQKGDPGMALLYDADTLPDGTPWFAMEYVDGLPLTEWCRAHRSSVPERLRLFRLVCEAVRHAHQHAVIHRDLKPSNILVDDQQVAKLADFGVARSAGDPGLTGTGMMIGSVAFMAPEIARGEAVTSAADIYSLGSTLFAAIEALIFSYADAGYVSMITDGAGISS